MSYFGISFKGNKEQLELIRLINENNRPIIICTGNAGTGKTFAALTAALDLQNRKKYKNIIFARNPVSVGADMGFLPGEIEDKYDPFMGPLYDNLESIIFHSGMKISVNDLKAKIKTIPIAFLRGRSFEDSIVIIDEAQNLDLTALKTILTRIGRYCKIILLGSMNQIDDIHQRKQDKCDFQKVIEVIKDLPYVGKCELIDSMRSPWCVEIDDILSKIK